MMHLFPKNNAGLRTTPLLLCAQIARASDRSLASEVDIYRNQQNMVTIVATKLNIRNNFLSGL
jgi:hypothetical protein